MKPHLRLALGLVALASCERAAPPLQAEFSVAEAMSAPADPRFERALAPRAFRFPEDHGPKPAFQTEWWYFTANLADDQGREFGCQLTFFRRAPRFEPASSASSWSSRDVFMAHFALLDVAGARFRAFERFERGGELGLAGATLEPQWSVWNRDWSASGSLERGGVVRLVAGEGDARLELTLRSRTGPVLHGDGGLSRKGAAPGAASYYYSLPRLDAEGTMALDGREHRVRGRAWFDREWSTSALDEEQAGWDWFALRLGDAGELMLYSLRRRDGARDPHASGSWIGPDGTLRALQPDEFSIEVLEHWRSPRTAVRYPSKWRVRVPSRGVELVLTPLLAAQELELTVRYWEGAVRIQGSVAGAPVDERGYVELAGY